MIEAKHGGVAAQSVLDVQSLVKTRQQGGVGFELEVPEFRVGRGEFVAVVGESGCGKSTLLDLLALVLKPTRCDRFTLYEAGGNEGLNALNISELWETGDEGELARVRRSYLGYVLQTGGLLPFLTVRQNLHLPMRVKGEKPSRERIETLTVRMGVEKFLAKKPQFLSGGQRQRVAILRALVHEPAIVLADEPTAAVDKTRARKIVADFRALAREGGSTIVMVTHDQPLVADVADRTFGFSVRQASETLTQSVCAEGACG